MRVSKYDFDYHKELEKAKFESNNAYNMAIGCLNRICVTCNEDEINRMVCGLLHDIEVISHANRVRIRITKNLEKEVNNESN